MMKKKINKHCVRLGYPLMYVDIVKTSSGKFRIGSAPEISKWLEKYHIKYDYVIMPPPVPTTMGDNYTGEEFIIWNQIHNNHKKAITYIGNFKDLVYLMKRLHLTIDQKFNKNQTQIITSIRIPKLCHIMPLVSNSIKIGKVEILFSSKNFEIFDNNSLIYSYQNLSPHKNISYETEKIVDTLPNSLHFSNNLKIFVMGNGNGFRYKTSNFLIQFGNRTIWIDVGAYPFLSLAKYKIHPDIITDYIITHNHEDHWEGFTAILQRARETQTIMNLITTKKIYHTLKQQISYIFPDMDNYIHFEQITPNIPHPYFKGIITARLNHHPLRQGVLGLKIEFNNTCFGLSGDTLYDEKILKKLNRIELTHRFFENCNLIFHEIEFKNPLTVHSYYKEVQKLQNKITGKLFAYHTHIRKKYFPLAKEGYWYILKNNHLEIKKHRTQR